jgi:hypothetical protein
VHLYIFKIKTLTLFYYFFCIWEKKKTKTDYRDLCTKYSNDQEDISESRWEIVDFFRNNYKRTLKDVSEIMINVQRPKDIQKKAEELYQIIMNNYDGLKDLVHFIMAFNLYFR